MNFAKRFLGVEFSYDDAASVRQALFCLFGFLIGFVSMLIAVLNLYFQAEYGLMYLNLVWVVVLVVSFLIARFTKSIKVISSVITIFFTLVTMYSFTQITPDAQLQYRSIMLVVLYFYLYNRRRATIYSFLFGIILVYLQLTLALMTSSHFRYFILAYYVITLCIIATGLATQKVEEIYSTKLKTAKNRDSLTGALNNAGLKEIMDKWVNEKREFSVVMLDIDNFKDVNDTMGHQIGDEYIKNIAKVLNRYTNDDMSFGRYGGDEFTVIKTKNKISSAAFLGLLKNQFANDPKYPMSISFGEASYHEGKDLEQVIYNADEALYYSKSHGKNCFTLYEDIRDENISIYNLSKERVIGHYMNFADKILTSLLVVDFKGKILQANKAFLKLIDVDSIKNINLETDDKEAIQFEDGDVALVKTKRTINNHQYSFNERFVAFRNEEGKIDYIISMIENEDN